MLLFNLALIAIIQGLTEFLPVSSSAHLILLHHCVYRTTSEKKYEEEIFEDYKFKNGRIQKL